MKTAACLLCILALAAMVSADRIAFTCEKQPDGSLLCTTEGLSECKRSPEWTVEVDGRQVDKARGWRVELWPLAGRRNQISVRLFVRGHEILIKRTMTLSIRQNDEGQ